MDTATTPASHRGPPSVFPLLVATLLALGLGPAAAFGSAPVGIDSLAILQHARYGPLLFAVDAEGGGIYFSRLEHHDRSPIRFEELRPYAVEAGYGAPSALSSAGGALAVAYREPAAVVVAEIETGRYSTIWRGAPLDRLLGVAVTRDHRVLVSREGRAGLLLFEPGESGLADGSTWRTVEVSLPGVGRPGRLLSWGEEVLVQDLADGAIHALPVRGGRPGNAEPQFDPWERGRDSSFDFTAVVDFAFHRGVFYASDSRRLVVLTRTESGAFQVPEAASRGAVGSLAVSDESLFVVDARHRVIRRTPRPVPAVVTLESGPKRAPEALVSALYDLSCRGLVAYREQVLEVGPMTLGNVLRSARLLGTEGPGERTAQLALESIRSVSMTSLACPAPAHYSSETLALRLFCTANPAVCRRAAEWPAGNLQAPVNAGTKLLLPAIRVEPYLTSLHEFVVAGSAEAMIAERVVSPELQRRVDSRLLYRINRSVAETKQAVLAQADFLAVSPLDTTTRAGSLVGVDGAGRPAAGVVTCPAPPVPVTPREIDLPRPLRSAFSPAKLSGRRSCGRALGEAGIETVELSFERALVESAPGLVSDAGGRLPIPGCTPSSGSLLVAETLTVEGARLRLVRGDGSVVYPSLEQLAACGVDGHPAAKIGWSVALDAPLIIGYRLVPWKEAMAAADPEMRRSAALATTRELIRSRLLGSHSGVLNLPLEAWRVQLVVTVDDLRADASRVRAAVSNEGSALFSTEELGLELLAVQVDERPVRDEDRWGVLEHNRRRLFEAIDYTPELGSRYRGVVGVAEQRGSVDFSHPGFRGEDGTLAWLRVGDGGIESGMQPLAAVERPESIRPFDVAKDHGTHVGSLIGGRVGRLGPGMLPSAELVLLEADTSASLHQSLTQADLHAQLSVVNLSGSYTHRWVTETDEFLQLLQSKSRVLFVLAAGNDGKSLDRIDRIPISWMPRVPHMIGVGAANWDRQLLRTWVDPETRETYKGSNYGKRWVHVLAPGFRVYGFAHANAYAHASGSSEAAPLVSATAAILSQRIANPLAVKARLIYTAEWYPHLAEEEAVWGGILNVRRAVWQQDRNLVYTQSEPEVSKAFTPKGNTAIIHIEGGRFYDLFGETDVGRRKVRFGDVLRITRLRDGFRVIYLDPGTRRLRIADRTQVRGTVKCDRLEVWDDRENRFVAPRAWNAVANRYVEGERCPGDLDVAGLYDYVAATPASVVFRH